MHRLLLPWKFLQTATMAVPLQLCSQVISAKNSLKPVRLLLVLLLLQLLVGLVHGATSTSVQLKLNENFLCDITENTLFCDAQRYQFMPYLAERKFAHNRIDKLFLKCSGPSYNNNNNNNLNNSSSPPWTLTNFVRENKKFAVLDYNSYITKRDLHELHIVECPVEEQPLSQLLEILFTYNDQFRLKVLNVSGGSGTYSSIEQLDYFLRKNEAIVRNLHVLEVANVQHQATATTIASSSPSATLELVHLKHLRRLKLINVTESGSNGGGGGARSSLKHIRTSASINKIVRPLPGSERSSGGGGGGGGLPSSSSDWGLVRLNSNLLELVLRNNSLIASSGSSCGTLLRNLSSLEQLDLSHNSLTVERVENCFQLDEEESREEGNGDDDGDDDEAETKNNEQSKRKLLEKLRVLHLNHNRISFRKRKLFSATSSTDEKKSKGLGELFRHLEVLSLDHNDINEVDEKTFSALTNLLVLTLTGNKLVTITENAFRPLVALRQLAIDSNRLQNVASLFGTSSNNNNKQPPNQLLDLNLNGNQLTELPAGIENSLVKLKSLDLGSNRIATINGKQFFGLTDLLGLRLVDNQLTRITKTAFHLLASLQIINLSANRISVIEADAFQFNPQLQIVRLDQNQLNILPKNCFKPLGSLLWLNLSNNALNKFYMNELPDSVELLDLHRNKIYEIKNMKGPDYLDHLRFLDLSHNHLPLLNEETIPNGLVEIDVEDNFITFIEMNTFANKNRLQRVNLRNNLLSRLESKLFFHKINQNHDLELLLAENPFDCDCSLEWLMILQETPPQNLQIVDLEGITCTSPIQRRRLIGDTGAGGRKDVATMETPVVRNSSDLKGNIRRLMDQSSTRIVEKRQQFLCKYETHCHTLCQCCDYEATCDCYMKCPQDCNCYYETTWQTNVVDCGGQANLTAVPMRIPVDATVLYLDGNDFHGGVLMADAAEQQHHLFLGRNKLTVLFLNHSQIESVSNVTLFGLGHLLELHLEHNRIARLADGNEFEHLAQLERLYLHDNRLEAIDRDTFRGLANLKVLTLRRNSFGRQEPFKFLLGSAALSRFIVDGVLVDLHVGNEFNCQFNCNEMVNAFRLGGGGGDDVTKQFLLSQFFKSKRANALKCAMESGGERDSSPFVIRAFGERCEFVQENQQLRLVNKSAAQGAQNAAFREYLRKHYLWPGGGAAADYLSTFAVAGTSILFLVFCIILAGVFRQHIQLMVFTRCGVRLRGPVRGGSGASGLSGGGTAAQLTVRRQSNGQLDLEPLCDAWVLCNERDYAYIESFVVDVMDRMGYYMQITSDWEQLPSSVEMAQRTVLVISSGFLQMEWQTVAFRQALYSMLGRIETRGSVAERLMVVVAVPTELLISDPQLLQLIQRATMVQLGEKRFWDKVRYAMPDVVGGGGGGVTAGGVTGVAGGGGFSGGAANEANRNNWRRKLKRYTDEEEGENQQPPMLPPKPMATGNNANANAAVASDRLSPDGTTTNEYDVLPVGLSGGRGGGSERSGSTARGSSCVESEEDHPHPQLGTVGSNLGNLHPNQKQLMGRNSHRGGEKLGNGIDNEKKIQSRYHHHQKQQRGGKQQQQQQLFHSSGVVAAAGTANSQQAYFV